MRRPDARTAQESRRLEALGALAAGMAHEINTPMQYIGDNLRFLHGAFDALAPRFRGAGEASRDTDVAYYLEEIPAALAQSLDGLAQVTLLVDALKRFATAPVHTVGAVDLNAAVTGVLTAARNEWKYVAEIALELDPGLPSVPGVAGQLAQVVLCLLLEAARASADARCEGRACGTIAVRTRRDGAWVELCVSDAGEAPDDARPRLLGASPEDDALLRVQHPDLGFVRDVVVVEHAGTIAVDAAPGRGTAVMVRLPIARAG